MRIARSVVLSTSPGRVVSVSVALLRTARRCRPRPARRRALAARGAESVSSIRRRTLGLGALVGAASRWRRGRPIHRCRRRRRRCLRRCDVLGDHDHDEDTPTVAVASESAAKWSRSARSFFFQPRNRGGETRRRPARPGARPSRGRGRGGRRGGASRDQASTASRSLVMARCRSVPALLALTPSTSAISALERSAWYLSAISSRSRAARRAERAPDGVALAASSAASSGSGSAGGPGTRRSRRACGAAARRARRCGRCRTATRAGPAAGVEAGAALVRALERLGGDVLGRGAVSQQRRGVGEDVVPRVPVERVEVERARPRWREESRCWPSSHPYYDRPWDPSQIGARFFRPRCGSRCSSPCSRCLLAPSAAAAREPRRGRRSTSATRPSSRTRSASAPRCPGTPKGARLSMRFRVQYKDGEDTWADVEDADSGWRALGDGQGHAASPAGASASPAVQGR